jgi:outer membrane protein assembly factor BamA
LIATSAVIREVTLIRTKFALTFLGSVLCIHTLSAQERAEEWRQARLEKVEVTQPVHRSTMEALLYEFKERNILQRFQSGFKGLHPHIGGLATGSGLAIGSDFRKERLAGAFTFKADARASLKRYQRYELGIEIPRLANQPVFVELNLRQRNYPQEDFFGTGTSSRKENRTNYKLEDTNVTATLGVRPKTWLTAGLRGGVLNTNTGRGTDSRFRSTESVFSETAAPGIESQPHYYHSGAFVDVDYRDHAQNPRSGGHYSASVTSYNDQSQGRFSFDQIDFEGQHYFPFFNKRRVIAARALATLTQTRDGQQVPFFMLPALGGSENLRGFQDFRFHDRNRVVMNLEYRWEVFSGLDMALFGDAGQVGEHASDLNFSHLKTSYGLGFRFNTERSVFLRVDIGRSNEGQRIFVKFGHVF